MNLMRIKQRITERGLGASIAFGIEGSEAKGEIVMTVPWCCRHPSLILYKGAHGKHRGVLPARRDHPIYFLV